MVKKLEKFSRAVFFSLFSAIGIFSISLAVLGPEWKNLYKIQAATEQAEKNNDKIEQILQDHDVLLNRINKDPNILKRLAPVTLGEKAQEVNMPPVEITAETLAQAKAAIEQSSGDENSKGSYEIPAWLQRATLKTSRTVLFAAGAGLVLVSFVCFSARKEKVTSGKSS
jgi:hypothetical protein